MSVRPRRDSGDIVSARVFVRETQRRHETLVIGNPAFLKPGKDASL